MKTSKYAFTMIELIFVIVILGILASVAIPKLSATRDDAYASKLAISIMTGASEIAGYAMSKGNVDSNLSVMSNSILGLVNTGDAILSSKKAKIKAGNINDCVVVSIDSNATTGTDTLNIAFSATGGDTNCQSLQNTIDANQYPMKLRGTNVKY